MSEKEMLSNEEKGIGSESAEAKSDRTHHQVAELQTGDASDEMVGERPPVSRQQPVPPGHMPFYRRKQIFTRVSLVVIGLDQLTKLLVINAMPLNTSAVPYPSLSPYFQLSHVANTGTLFGLFPQAQNVFAILAVVVSLAIAYFNYQLPTRSLKLRLALGLVFGGAIGNLIDRLRLGYVTDFLDFNLRPLLDWSILDWPVFNIADLSLVLGIAILTYLSWREPEALEG
jgi:signal peptidase II